MTLFTGRRSLWGIAFVAQLSAVCASAQVPVKVGPSTTFAALSREATPVDGTDQVREMVIRWSLPSAARGESRGAPAERLFVVLDQRAIGTIRRERNPQMSEDQLVLVQRSAEGTVLDWRLIRNPRLVRAEVPGPDGRLSGRILERESAEMLMTLPNLEAATRLSIYQPQWNGTDFLLDLVGEVPLRRIR